MSDSGRRWLEVAVRCSAAEDLAPLLIDGLLALGGRAAEERDGWFVTHLDSPEDLDTFEADARAQLVSVTGIEQLELRTSWREHEDWAETWKRGLGFRRITDRIAVRPSWIAEPADAPEIVLVVDPGMAFGTAEHGTTRGCLRLLDGVVTEGEHVLDVGSGSGVLAVAAVRLGASEVVAIEGDTLACEALAENLEHNGVADCVRWLEALVDAEGLAAYAPVDGVVANIESGTLRRLMPGFAAALKPSGWLVLSGILGEEWPSLRTVAEEAGFELREVDSDGEWRSGLFTRLGEAAQA
jgi:ribosomal protein L11 methyltransferase